jgi:hypothetical protein
MAEGTHGVVALDTSAGTSEVLEPHRSEVTCTQDLSDGGDLIIDTIGGDGTQLLIQDYAGIQDIMKLIRRPPGSIGCRAFGVHATSSRSNQVGSDGLSKSFSKSPRNVFSFMFLLLGRNKKIRTRAKG